MATQVKVSDICCFTPFLYKFNEVLSWFLCIFCLVCFTTWTAHTDDVNEKRMKIFWQTLHQLKENSAGTSVAMQKNELGFIAKKADFIGSDVTSIPDL